MVAHTQTEENPLTILGAPFLGLVTLVLVVIADIALSSAGLLDYGSHHISAYIGLAFASILGGAMATSVSGSPLAKALYLVTGAAAFWALATLQAVSSDGHPDKLLRWAPVWHLAAAPLGLWLTSKTAPVGAKLAGLAGILTLVTMGCLAYAGFDRTARRGELKASAKTATATAFYSWLPQILADRPFVQWNEPSYSEIGFDVHGSWNQGRIELAGQGSETTGQLTVFTKHPAPFWSAKDPPAKALRRMAAFLHEEGFNEQVVAQLKEGARPGLYTDELGPIPRDPEHPRSGAYFLSLNLWPYASQVNVSFFTPGPVRAR